MYGLDPKRRLCAGARMKGNIISSQKSTDMKAALSLNTDTGLGILSGTRTLSVGLSETNAE